MAHPTVPVAFGAWSADVDVEIAPLVLALWRAGIETVSACQDEGESALDFTDVAPWSAEHGGRYANRAYVDLLHLEDACRFLDAVANAGPRDGLYQRMSSPAPADAWEVRATLYDSRVTQGGEDGNAPSSFRVGVIRVRFPRSDIAEISARLG